MDDLDFLREFASDNASLMVITPDGRTHTINNLNTAIIGKRCPLLELSFEQGSSGIPRASLDATSKELIVRFIRYLYLGDYLVYDHLHEEPMPCSLLIHAELCRMGDIYEIPELQVTAHANIIRETEFSCYRPTPPIDLCAAVRFMYERLADQKPLIETLLNYCVYAFQSHGLGSSTEFRQVAYECRAFHRDLCRTNVLRDFQDDGASEIVRLPVCRPNPHSEEEFHKQALGDFLFELWCDSDDSQAQSDPESRERKRRKMYVQAGFTLVHRPKDPSNANIDEGNSSDETYGFTMVYRHKPGTNVVKEEESEDSCSGTESGAESVSDTGPIVNIKKEEKMDDSLLTIKPDPYRPSLSSETAIGFDSVESSDWDGPDGFEALLLEELEKQEANGLTSDPPNTIISPEKMEGAKEEMIDLQQPSISEESGSSPVMVPAADQLTGGATFQEGDASDSEWSLVD